MNPYRATIIKIIDLSLGAYWYAIEGQPRLLIDLAKTYLWVSSVIGAVAMFMVKDLSPTPLAASLLAAAIALCCGAFVLAFLVLWGRGVCDMPLSNPMNFAEFAFRHLGADDVAEADLPYNETLVYGAVMRSMNDSIAENIATNTKRAKTLRRAAPCLVASFILLMCSVLARLLNV